MIDTGGAPSLGFSVDPREQQFNPTRLTDGSWPSGGDQVVIDKATASARASTSGDTIELQAVGPQRSFHISGIAELSGRRLDRRRHLCSLRPPDRAAGVRQARSARRHPNPIEDRSQQPRSSSSEIKPLLPPTATVRDANAQVKEDKKEL